MNIRSILIIIGGTLAGCISLYALAIIMMLASGDLTTCNEPHDTFSAGLGTPKGENIRRFEHNSGGGMKTEINYVYTRSSLKSMDEYVIHYRNEIETSSAWTFVSETRTERTYQSTWAIDGVCEDWQAVFILSFYDEPIILPPFEEDSSEITEMPPETSYTTELVIKQPEKP